MTPTLLPFHTHGTLDAFHTKQHEKLAMPTNMSITLRECDVFECVAIAFNAKVQGVV
jgi:hypothetical protein